MSTQKLVVTAVRAESVPLNDAATMPMEKSTSTSVPIHPDAVNIGISSSLSAGNAIPSLLASNRKSTPRERKSRLTGKKKKPPTQRSFCASHNDLQVRFFCIMCWSRPVITTTMNIPLRNCLKKFCVETKSSNTKIRLWGLAATAEIASPTVMSSFPIA